MEPVQGQFPIIFIPPLFVPSSDGCNGLRVHFCQDVCKYLRPILCFTANLCAFRSVGTAGGLSYYCSSQLF